MNFLLFLLYLKNIFFPGLSVLNAKGNGDGNFWEHFFIGTNNEPNFDENLDEEFGKLTQVICYSFNTNWPNQLTFFQITNFPIFFRFE